MLAAARADEYSGAPGVGRAPAALVNMQDLTAAALDHRRHDGAQEQVRRLDAADEHRRAGRRPPTRRKRPTTIAPVDATAESNRPNRSSAVSTSSSVAPGARRSRRPLTTATVAPGASQLVDEAVCGVTEHEIVGRREQAGQRRPDVVGGVADDRDGTRTHARQRRSVGRRRTDRDDSSACPPRHSETPAASFRSTTLRRDRRHMGVESIPPPPPPPIPAQQPFDDRDNRTSSTRRVMVALALAAGLVPLGTVLRRSTSTGRSPDRHGSSTWRSATASTSLAESGRRPRATRRWPP